MLYVHHAATLQLRQLLIVGQTDPLVLDLFFELNYLFLLLIIEQFYLRLLQTVVVFLGAAGYQNLLNSLAPVEKLV